MFGGLVSAPTVTFQAILHSELVEPALPLCQNMCKAFNEYIYWRDLITLYQLRKVGNERSRRRGKSWQDLNLLPLDYKLFASPLCDSPYCITDRTFTTMTQQNRVRDELVKEHPKFRSLMEV